MTPADLRAVRKSLGHTQKRMAEVLGVSLSQYGCWERGIDKRTGRAAPVPRLVELVCQAPAAVLGAFPLSENKSG